MSIKSKALRAAAALTLLGGVAAAGSAATTQAAQAATPSCGTGLPCVNIFSHEFDQYPNPNYVADVFRQGLKVGQPVILFKASNSDPAEDFTLSLQGNVSDFYAAGIVSSAVEIHYGGGKFLPPPFTPNPNAVDEAAFEIEYAPFGVDSGLCMGVASAAFQNEKVTLQPCGVTARTVWIWDTYDQPAPWGPAWNGSTFPAINGSDTNFSHPFVLSYPKNGEPWAKPRPQLQVQNLTGFSNGFGPTVGQVPDWQLWGGTIGELK